MPDWTYHPLRPLAAAVLGRRRSQRAALRALATLTSLPGGAGFVAGMFDHSRPPADLAARLGAVVPVAFARDAIRALPVQGAGVIEIGPVAPADVPLVRRAVAGRRCLVIVRASTPEVAARLAPHADRVVVGDAPDLVHLADPAVARAVEALADPDVTVLATPAALVAAGPGWFQRVIEAVTPTEPPAGLREIAPDPRRWPGWWWGLLVGLGMIVAGLGAALITIGPLLLWYDEAYLGMDRHRLDVVNHRLAPFLQHDRITMAGTMVAIGVLYAGLAWGGLRQGWGWSRRAYLASGLVAFSTLFSFLGTGFVEPLHTAVTVVLFPMFLLAALRSPERPRWTARPEGPERLRRRALTGQLLMIMVGLGLFAGGAVISVVGLTEVFVSTDLAFLGTDPGRLDAASPRLVPFIAHDRAGFGGALMAAALAVILISMWGWRRGESWVWWSSALAAAAGFLPAVVVHMIIGYTSFVHLAPVYAGIGLTALALSLARPYLCAGRGRVRGDRRTGPVEREHA
ncbi:hypothetical protein [Planobispora longispora]|uniref:Uncharacterized protein n=1 Tax=Planobispora longispora TaxID=28887 RepID=A0A8J3RNA4_9ACTN|nr:hypothetical protein [Planobispora longispora]GIH78089.1 hypothetical protein Plo01_45180 [Planobispora longispora]